MSITLPYHLTAPKQSPRTRHSSLCGAHNFKT